MRQYCFFELCGVRSTDPAQATAHATHAANTMYVQKWPLRFVHIKVVLGSK